MKNVPAPSNATQGMECGCRIYFDGWYKVAYCAPHDAAPDLLVALQKAVPEGCVYDAPQAPPRPAECHCAGCDGRAAIAKATEAK